jgi:hypothetical protein
MHSLTQRELNYGSFILCWTDENLGNFTVDDEFNITSILDLEWCCCRPIETEYPPLWLSGRALHSLPRANEADFTVQCEDFLRVFEQVDSGESVLGPGFFTKVMRDALSKKTYWLMTSLNEPRATYNLFLEPLQVQFAPKHSEIEAAIQFQEIVAPYWTVNATAFIAHKLHQREGRISGPVKINVQDPICLISVFAPKHISLFVCLLSDLSPRFV